MLQDKNSEHINRVRVMEMNIQGKTTKKIIKNSGDCVPCRITGNDDLDLNGEKFNKMTFPTLTDIGTYF
jgi:hypothetical protein